MHTAAGCIVSIYSWKKTDISDISVFPRRPFRQHLLFETKCWGTKDSKESSLFPCCCCLVAGGGAAAAAVAGVVVCCHVLAAAAAVAGVVVCCHVLAVLGSYVAIPGQAFAA